MLLQMALFHYFLWLSNITLGNIPWDFPGGAIGKEPACQCRRLKRHMFDLWVWKVPWSRAWQPTPVFLPGEFHRWRSLAGCSPLGCQESDTTEVAYKYSIVHIYCIFSHSSVDGYLG